MMEVRAQTPERLVLEARPIVLPVLFAVAMVASIGGGGAAIFLGKPHFLHLAIMAGGLFAYMVLVYTCRITVFLERSAGMILLRRTTMVSHREMLLRLPDLQCAILECTKSDETPFCRPVLTMTNGTEVALWHVFIAGNGAAETVTIINDWLRAHAPAA